MTFLALRLCGRAESLSAHPSESHLCFSPTHLWPFSSSLLQNSVSVRSCGGTWEAGRGRRKRGNIFLWMFPVVPSVRECFQAWRSCKVFFFLGKYRRASTFCFVFCFWLTAESEKAIFNQTNRYQRACQMWEAQRSRAKISHLRKQGHCLICHKSLFCTSLRQIQATSACLSGLTRKDRWNQRA